MIHPTLQVTAEIYIHAAREAVWARFCRLTDWPHWRADVAQTSWVRGQSWTEDARFRVQPAGGGSASDYLIRMVVPADTTVWETGDAGQGMVYSLQLTDQVGGCKGTLRCTFHGWGSLLKRLNQASEAARLHAILNDLKEASEQGGPRR